MFLDLAIGFVKDIADGFIEGLKGGLKPETQKGTHIALGEEIPSLSCKIVELTEQQNYGIPSLPIDNGTTIGDTIYKMPLTVTARVFVTEANLDTFLYEVEKGQYNQTCFTIYSLYNKVYNNMKIESYSRDTNSSMIGAMHFNIQFKELILVQALVSNYQVAKKAGYGSAKNIGNKNPQETPKSTLFLGGKTFGAF